LEKSINKLSKNNKIIVCGTSVHKVSKIKKIINKIDFIFLNKAELFKLTNSSNIIIGVNKILKQNRNIKIVATNSKNNVIFGSSEFIKKIKPPSLKVVNENGAGDALAAMMLYLLSKEKKMDDILKTSVACGSYYANGNSLTKKSDYLKVKNLSKKVKIQKV
jgi:fructose-1-phosphate kinase PfkB-like protein